MTVQLFILGEGEVSLFYYLFIYLFIYLFAVVGFELRAYTLSHSTSPFFVVGCFFQDRVSWTTCQSWL
jgi:hypothetical protein